MNSWVSKVKENPLFEQSANAPTQYTFGDLKLTRDNTSLELPAKKKKAEDPSFTEIEPVFDIKITVGEGEVEMDIRDIGAVIALLLSESKPVAELTKEEFNMWVVDMEAIAQTEDSVRNSLEFLRSTETELRKQSGAPAAAPFDLKKAENYPLFIWALAVNVQNAEETVAPSLLPAASAPATAATTEAPV